MIPIEENRQQAPFARKARLHGYSGFSCIKISIQSRNKNGKKYPLPAQLFPCQILPIVKISELYTEYPQNHRITAQRIIKSPVLLPFPGRICGCTEKAPHMPEKQIPPEKQYVPQWLDEVLRITGWSRQEMQETGKECNGLAIHCKRPRCMGYMHKGYRFPPR